MGVLEFLMENIIQKEKSKNISILKRYVQFDSMAYLYKGLYYKIL